MSLKYGFYDSTNASAPDRYYYADDVNNLLDALVNEGIFANRGDCFHVTVNNGQTGIVTVPLKIEIGTGIAWINNTWSRNTSTYEIEMPQSQFPESGHAALYAAIIEINKSQRLNSFKIIKGAEANIMDADTAWSNLFSALVDNASNVSDQKVLSIFRLSRTGLPTNIVSPIDMINADVNDPTYGSYTGYQGIFTHNWNINTISTTLQTTGLQINGVDLDPSFNTYDIHRYGGESSNNITPFTDSSSGKKAGDVFHYEDTPGVTKMAVMTNDMSAMEDTSINAELQKRIPIDSNIVYKYRIEDITAESSESGGYHYLSIPCSIYKTLAHRIQERNGTLFPKKVTLHYDSYTSGAAVFQKDEYYYNSILSENLSSDIYSLYGRYAASNQNVANTYSGNDAISIASLSDMGTHWTFNLVFKSSSAIPYFRGASRSYPVIVELEW